MENNTTDIGFTSGKWMQDPLLGGVFGYEVTDLNGNTIADCYKNSYYKKMPHGREIAQANAAHIVECVNNYKALTESIKQAIGVIKQWHNADDVWEIYYNHAPEMKLIRETISNLKLQP